MTSGATTWMGEFIANISMCVFIQACIYPCMFLRSSTNSSLLKLKHQLETVLGII